MSFSGFINHGLVARHGSFQVEFTGGFDEPLEITFRFIRISSIVLLKAVGPGALVGAADSVQFRSGLASAPSWLRPKPEHGSTISSGISLARNDSSYPPAIITVSSQGIMIVQRFTGTTFGESWTDSSSKGFFPNAAFIFDLGLP